MSAELTEAEREGLIEAVQDGTEAAYVEDIIEAREVAARREAADDVFRLSAKVARVEALAEEFDGVHYMNWSGALVARRIRKATAALAEPERDEEGSR